MAGRGTADLSSSGRRGPMESSRSARRSWPICSTGSTGGTRFAPGGQRQLPRPAADSLTSWLRRARAAAIWENQARDDAREPPDDIAALQAALAAERANRIEEAARAARVEAELAVAKAKASDDHPEDGSLWSTALVGTAWPPSLTTASSACSRSSPTKEPSTAHRRRSNGPNSLSCGLHRMLTLVPSPVGERRPGFSRSRCRCVSWMCTGSGRLRLKF